MHQIESGLDHSQQLDGLLESNSKKIGFQMCSKEISRPWGLHFSDSIDQYFNMSMKI